MKFTFVLIKKHETALAAGHPVCQLHPAHGKVNIEQLRKNMTEKVPHL